MIETVKEAKEYADRRFAEISEENPLLSRDKIATVIIQELLRYHRFAVFMPGTNVPLVGVKVDPDGIIKYVIAE